MFIRVLSVCIHVCVRMCDRAGNRIKKEEAFERGIEFARVILRSMRLI